HLDRSWVGHFTSNPFEFDTPERGAPPRQGWPVGEVQAITIEFEGVQQAAGTLTPVIPPPPPLPPPVPTFNIGSLGNLQHKRGAIVPITWTAANVAAGAKIS